MPPSPARILPLAPILACALACAMQEPTRELHQWTDADGNVVYTAHPERIPVVRESTHRVVEPGRSAGENAAPTPEEPPAAAEPPPPVSARPADTPEPAAEPDEALAPPPPADLDARIAELETRIAADEEALKALISDPAKAGALRGSPEVREIGERLPVLQAELAALRAQRAEREASADEPDDPGDDG